MQKKYIWGVKYDLQFTKKCPMRKWFDAHPVLWIAREQWKSVT